MPFSDNRMTGVGRLVALLPVPAYGSFLAFSTRTGPDPEGPQRVEAVWKLNEKL
jgi:hypothetical protein